MGTHGDFVIVWRGQTYVFYRHYDGYFSQFGVNIIKSLLSILSVYGNLNVLKQTFEIENYKIVDAYNDIVSEEDFKEATQKFENPIITSVESEEEKAKIKEIVEVSENWQTYLSNITHRNDFIQLLFSIGIFPLAKEVEPYNVDNPTSHKDCLDMEYMYFLDLDTDTFSMYGLWIDTNYTCSTTKDDLQNALDYCLSF